MATWTCRRCDYSADKEWEGYCPGCRGLYRARKVGGETEGQKRSTFASAEVVKKNYIVTGVDGFDRTIGGGLIAGCVVLFGGFRGAGKSTLLVRIADTFSKQKEKPVLYASSEQNEEGVIDIAHRCGARSESVIVRGNQTNIQKTLEEVKKEKAWLTIYDSLQKFTSFTCSGAQGSNHQGSAVTREIIAYHRKTKTCGIIVNQMAKDGGLKGGEDVEHEVDTIAVLAFPKDDKDEEMPQGEENIRMLVVDKNRNGPEGIKTYWRMTDTGLEYVPPQSRILDESGSRKYRRTG